MTDDKKIALIDEMEDVELDVSHFKILKKLSSDENDFVRSRCASLLINFKTEESLTLLLDLCNDDDAFTRAEAYDSLAMFYNTRVEKALYNAINSENDELALRYAIVSWADIVSNLYSDGFKKHINFVLNKINTEISEGCLLAYYYALHLFGYNGAVEKIISFLKNDDYSIRCSSLNMLKDVLNEENKGLIKVSIIDRLKTEEAFAVKSLVAEILDGLETL